MFRIKYHGKGIFDFTGENIITKILQNELYQANYTFVKTSISRTKKKQIQENFETYLKEMKGKYAIKIRFREE